MRTFGHDMRQDFLIEEGYVCVNHSSFGYIPKYIRDIKFELCNKYLENPDKFIRFNFTRQYKELRNICAEFLGGNGNQSFITTSSAESFNSIIKNLPLTKEDTILYTNLVYPMVENTLKYMNERFGINLIKLEFSIEDLTTEKILKKVEEHLSGKSIKVFVFDNITALPSIKMPIYELVKQCQKYDVISIIDAAHGAGIREINLEELNADFFYTNFNKWAFCPTGVNMLYMKEKYIKQIHHNNISVFYGAGLDKEFEYNGTNDRSNLLLAKEGIEFINKYGLKNIIKYSEEIAWEGTKLVGSIWETQLMIDDKNMHSAMVNVRAPIDDENILKECQRICCEKYNVLVVFCKFNEKMWARFTGTIYNDLSDYEYAAKSILEVLKEMKQ